MPKSDVSVTHARVAGFEVARCGLRGEGTPLKFTEAFGNTGCVECRGKWVESMKLNLARRIKEDKARAKFFAENYDPVMSEVLV
jgi:hypothetical protein